MGKFFKKKEKEESTVSFSFLTIGFVVDCDPSNQIVALYNWNKVNSILSGNPLKIAGVYDGE